MSAGVHRFWFIVWTLMILANDCVAGVFATAEPGDAAWPGDRSSVAMGSPVYRQTLGRHEH
jgi:hypothetical protein